MKLWRCGNDKHPMKLEWRWGDWPTLKKPLEVTIIELYTVKSKGLKLSIFGCGHLGILKPTLDRSEPCPEVHAALLSICGFPIQCFFLQLEVSRERVHIGFNFQTQKLLRSFIYSLFFQFIHPPWQPHLHIPHSSRPNWELNHLPTSPVTITEASCCKR